jgi:hypothetical protein
MIGNTVGFRNFGYLATATKMHFVFRSFCFWNQNQQHGVPAKSVLAFGFKTINNKLLNHVAYGIKKDNVHNILYATPWFYVRSYPLSDQCGYLNFSL